MSALLLAIMLEKELILKKLRRWEVAAPFPKYTPRVLLQRCCSPVLEPADAILADNKIYPLHTI